MPKQRILAILEESLRVKKNILENTILQTRIEEVIQSCIHSFKNGGQVLFCGNGGSAADAQHLAAEFSGRFYLDRAPLPSEALHVNTSFLTAVANDYNYQSAFARAVEAKGRKGDVLFAISTSGNSLNIIDAAKKAKEKEMIVVGMTGQTGGKLAQEVDFLLNMPSINTPRIQEGHILVGHIICELVEQAIFGNEAV